jgi:hypothetical protein
MNPLNSEHPSLIAPAEKTFQQHTQQGTNQVNVTEHNTAVGIPNLTGHLLPPVIWSRWFLRWVGCFAVGCAVPFLVAALPPIGGVLVPMSMLVALAIGAGYCCTDRRVIGVTLVCLSIAVIGLFVTLSMVIPKLFGG